MKLVSLLIEFIVLSVELLLLCNSVIWHIKNEEKRRYIIVQKN
jgi:hypothetical protein